MRRFLVSGLLAALVAPAALAAPPRWQSGAGDLEGFRGVWAAERAWFFKDDTGAGANEIEIRSAPIGASRLGSWSSRRLPDAITALRVLADKLLYTRPDGALRAVALRPDGSLGAPEPVTGAPADGAPPAPLSSQIVQLPDRVVWVVEVPVGVRSVRRYGCCTPAGEAVDYSAFLPPSVKTRRQLALGRDAAGRLWLAWIESRRAGGPVKAIELSPDTLQPLGTPRNTPLPKSFAIVGMPCAASCYVVTETVRGPAYSWRPGAASATRIPLTRTNPSSVAALSGIDLVGGRMLFAYWGDSTRSGLRVRLARGNASGANARVLRTIHDPSRLGPNTYASGTPTAIVGSRGAVVFQRYTNFATGREFFRAAFLRR